MFTTIAMKNNFSSDIWILDSGVSCHYCRSAEGFTDIKEINESIKIGNAELLTGIDKRKLTTNSTKDTENEGNESGKKVFRAEEIGKLVQSTSYQGGRRSKSWKGY
jgi:hypothetical protein